MVEINPKPMFFTPARQLHHSEDIVGLDCGTKRYGYVIFLERKLRQTFSAAPTGIDGSVAVDIETDV
jgi:hypothetical protein